MGTSSFSSSGKFPLLKLMLIILEIIGDDRPLMYFITLHLIPSAPRVVLH